MWHRGETPHFNLLKIIFAKLCIFTQLFTVKVVYCLGNWTDCVEQCSVSLLSFLCVDFRLFSFNQVLFFKALNVFPDGIAAHFQSLPDCAVARITLKCLTILAPQKKTIHGNLAVRQAEAENFVWQSEIMFRRIV